MAARLCRPLGGSNCIGNDRSGKTRRWSSGWRPQEDGLSALDTWGILGLPWQPPSRVTTVALALVVARPQSDGKSGETGSLPYGVARRTPTRCRKRFSAGAVSRRRQRCDVPDVRLVGLGDGPDVAAVVAAPIPDVFVGTGALQTARRLRATSGAVLVRHRRRLGGVVPSPYDG